MPGAPAAAHSPVPAGTEAANAVGARSRVAVADRRTGRRARPRRRCRRRRSWTPNSVGPGRSPASTSNPSMPSRRPFPCPIRSTPPAARPGDRGGRRAEAGRARPGPLPPLAASAAAADIDAGTTGSDPKIQLPPLMPAESPAPGSILATSAPTPPQPSVAVDDPGPSGDQLAASTAMSAESGRPTVAPADEKPDETGGSLTLPRTSPGRPMNSLPRPTTAFRGPRADRPQARTWRSPS